MNVIDVHRHNAEIDEVAQNREAWDSLGYRYVCYSGSNAFIRDLMKRYPDYVIGLAHPKMDNGPFYWRNDDAGLTQAMPPDEIERFREQGFRGLKVIYTAKPYSHPDYFPYYERAQALNMPVLFHTGWVSGGHEHLIRFQENYQPVYLQTIAGHFPELPVIGAHFGGWQFSEQAVIAMWKCPNVYFDLCGGTVCRQPMSFYRDLFSLVPLDDPEAEPAIDLSIFGKLVYGTDNGDGIMAFYRRLLRELNIPEAVQQDIFYNNMARVLALEADG